MSNPFLHFLESLQQREGDRAANQDRGRQPSAAAHAAAAAAPASRPRVSDRLPELSSASAAEASGSGIHGHSGLAHAPAVPAVDSSIPWSEVQSARNRIGPNLARIFNEQAQRPLAERESYSLEHVSRLEMFRYSRPYTRLRANVLCAKAHPQPCKSGCRTCHFCRQRTIEVKTVCSRCEGVKDQVGGAGRGYWCGACLWLRMGENIEEVRHRPDWICPGCRDLCNCSAPSCLRGRRGWLPTNQLSHEATQQGFRSVAHYLVLTHVSAAVLAAPIVNIAHLPRPGMRQREGGEAPAAKRARFFGPAKSTEQSLRQASAASVQAELAAVQAEMQVGGGTAAGSALQRMLGQGELALGGGRAGPAFLGILDADMQDDGDDYEPTVPSLGAAASGAGSGPGRPFDADRRQTGLHRAAAMTSAAAGTSSAASFSHFDLLPPRRRTLPAAALPPPPAAVQGNGGAAAPPLAAVDANAAALRRLLPDDGDVAHAHGGLPGGEDAPVTGHRTAHPRAAPLDLGHLPARPAAAPRPMAAPPQGGLPPVGTAQRAEPAARWHSAPTPRPRLDFVNLVDPSPEAAPGPAQRRWMQQADQGDGGSAVGMPLAGEPSGGQAGPSSEGGRIGEERTANSPDCSRQEAAAPVGSSGAAQEEAAAGGATATPAAGPLLSAVGAGTGGDAAFDPDNNAHTQLEAREAAMQHDEIAWNELAELAHGAVTEVVTLDLHHPDNPHYAGPLLGAGADVAAYQLAYSSLDATLKGVLGRAGKLLPIAAVVPSPVPAGEEGGALLYSFAGLRCATRLFTFLARVLKEEADVKWEVEERLRGAVPFLDFDQSGARAKAILLTQGLFELLATLQHRKLPTGDTAAEVATRLVRVADEMVAAEPLLSAMLADNELPDGEVRVGPWRFDAAARQLSHEELFSELLPIYLALKNVLVNSLRRAVQCCSSLGVGSAAFLPPALVEALLGSHRLLPQDVKREALLLICAVLDACSPRRTDGVADLQLSVNERTARREARGRLCDVLHAAVVPALEAMVAQDFPLWGGSGGRGSGGSQAQDPGVPMGSEKVEVLARCYAFLVETRRLGWPAVEAKAAQPYSYSQFWRQANATYRHFAVFLLAHTLAHAPDSLAVLPCAASAMHTWLLSMTDTGGRQCASYLTHVLATAPATAHLFAGTEAADRDLRGDVTGDTRAALVAAVMRNVVYGGQWRLQLSAVLGDLDGILAARRREIEAAAFDPRAAVLRWEAVACKVVMALLRAAQPVLSPPARLGAPPDAAAIKLKALLSCAATWAVGSCTAVHRSYAPPADSGVVSGGSGDPLGDRIEEEEEEGALQTEAAVRQRLRGTPFSLLPDLLQVLVAAGAPHALRTDAKLMHSLWVVLAGCVEQGSGREQPTPVDRVMLQMLGAALATSHAGEAQEEGAPLPPPPASSLCTFVLATFMRRWLHRSALNHATHERAAVNALRLTQEILMQPAMRGPAAREAALTVLLRPLLEVLSPDSRATPSKGAKEAVLRLVCKLVVEHPSVLPPLHPAPAQNQGITPALHAFWLAVCRDALNCVATMLQPEARQRGLLKLQLRAAAAGGGTLLLQPSTPQTVAEASNALLGALGRPTVGCEGVDRAYEGFASDPLPGLFRPGHFGWTLAVRGVELVQTLLVLPPPREAGPAQAAGPQWAMACFPALHYLITAQGEATAHQELYASYRALRARVRDVLGAQALEDFPLERQAAAPRQPVVRSSAEQEQEQQQPNRGGPLGQLATVPPTPCPGVSRDATLSELLAAQPETRVSVVACIKRPRRAADGGTALFIVQDLLPWVPGAARTEENAVVRITGPPLVVAQLLQLGGPEWTPTVVRLGGVTASLVTRKTGPAALMLVGKAATLDLHPTGARADELRAHFGAGPAAAAELPTQPMASQRVEVKPEPLDTQGK